MHTPVHSPGSICLITSTGELFTSDVAYYGDQFLPKKEEFPQVLNTLSELIALCEKQKNLELYPSHRNYPCDITLLTDLTMVLKILRIYGIQRKISIFLIDGRLTMRVANSDITYQNCRKIKKKKKL